VQNVIQFFPGIEVQWSSNGILWGTRGCDIVASSDSGKNWTKLTTIPAERVTRVLSKIRIFRRLLRLNVRGYLQPSDGELVFFYRGNIFRWQEGGTKPITIGRVRRGRGPLHQGCCVDDYGNCYYGEYWRNAEREDVNIYRLKNGGTFWDLFYSFPKGAIRHIHAVQFDSFAGAIWVTTGDHDQESSIGYFEISPYGQEFKVVASGNQMCRAVSLLFTREYVYWGSDGGRGTAVKANHIYRWSRKSKVVDQVAEIGAPVYFSTVDIEGRLFVATVVEGSASEIDAFARIWMSKDGLKWCEIGRWQKDCWPFVFGYGLLSFPQGKVSGESLYVVGSGVRGSPGTWVLNAASV
jgi:hypothetical protein